MLKVILLLGFCPFKTELARFPIGFRLKMNCLMVSKMEGTLTNLIHVVPKAPGTSNKSQPLERKNKNKDHQLFRVVNYTKSHAQLQNTCWHIKR